MSHQQRSPEEKLRNRIDAHVGFHRLTYEESSKLRSQKKMCGYLRLPFGNTELTEVRGLCAFTMQGCNVYETCNQGKYECFVYQNWFNHRQEELKRLGLIK
jgi:hypothetical protein